MDFILGIEAGCFPERAQQLFAINEGLLLGADPHAGEPSRVHVACSSSINEATMSFIQCISSLQTTPTISAESPSSFVVLVKSCSKEVGVNPLNTRFCRA